MITRNRSCNLAAVLLIGSLATSAMADDKIDFNRQVRTILSDKCFACHGPDTAKIKAKLRLDVRDVAVKRGAIVPGQPHKSELISRIFAKEPTQVMPPVKTNKTLSEAEKQVLKQSISEGAEYRVHWAFSVPVKPAPPALKQRDWPRNPIDHFILARLEKENLSPMPEANRAALLRRITFDLTGLPPTLEEIDAFVNDASSDAYEKVVDRLLRSPRYGEHMGRYWLDAARYGDTHGMHLDNYREMWPYRDWVVRAFNKNQPFNQFIVEQVAGDLLPGATLEQTVATGFLRCHVTTNEGGTIEEEAYVRNVNDRVDTNGTVFFGMTLGCAKCHDHKYDPISMKEYYQIFAFFNNMDGNNPQHPPVVRMPTPDQARMLAQLESKVGDLQKQVAQAAAKVKYDPAA